jgi:hypothetical protein
MGKHDHNTDTGDVKGELEELEGPAQEMEGEASASEDSLAKEKPQPEHQLGERPGR